MPSKNSSTISIRLSNSLRYKLEERATQKGFTPSEAIREALEQWLGVYTPNERVFTPDNKGFTPTTNEVFTPMDRVYTPECLHQLSIFEAKQNYIP